MSHETELGRELDVVEEIMGEIAVPKTLLLRSEMYPEVLLQHSEHGYKYYAAFQRHSRQFIATEPEMILRWKNSDIEKIQAGIIESSFLGGNQTKTAGDSGGRSYSRPSANALFSWSSDDAYIQAKKKELLKRPRLSTILLRGGDVDSITSLKTGEIGRDNDDIVNDDEEVNKNEGEEEQIVLEKYNLKLLNELMNQMNSIIEMESNRFIRERIEVIKEHHSEQISKQINERKRKDHELHLQRLRMKEEQFERELRAATEDKEKEKGNKFLLLFSFNNNEKVSGLENSTADLAGLGGDLAGTAGLGPEIAPQSPSTTSKQPNEPGSKTKRFSFLPNALFSKDSGKKEANGSGRDEKIDVSTIEDHTSTVEASESVNKATENLSEEPNEPSEQLKDTNKPISIDRSEIDLIFNGNSAAEGSNKLLPVDELEDFDDFKVALPSKENKVAGHEFMAMAEPKPLIEFD